MRIKTGPSALVYLWLYGIYANLSLLWSIITSLYYVKCVRFFGPAIKNTEKTKLDILILPSGVYANLKILEISFVFAFCSNLCCRIEGLYINSYYYAK